MSGFLGRILENVVGGQAGAPPAIAGILQQVLASEGGGIGAIVSRFTAAGLGNAAQSWVGTGQNQPVSADDIGKVFPADQIEGWATQAGTTPDKLRAVLAEVLPHAVDHVTPDGATPPAGAMPDFTSLISRFLGSAPQ
ncbi:MAG: YidB family protein [Acetobacteraceae bacterium]